MMRLLPVRFHCDPIRVNHKLCGKFPFAPLFALSALMATAGAQPMEPVIRKFLGGQPTK
jgi:hypothetical protein